MSVAKLQRFFPHLKSPIICNGPMRSAACPALAVEVVKAGGIGMFTLVSPVDTLYAHGSGRLFIEIGK
jgi:NAD(P)H-dependent flavin oxidoreductase YrpB (nitropropane dioxygenase family)